MPPPKAPILHYTAWRQRLPYSIRVKPLLNKHRKKSGPVSKEKIRNHRKRLREAVRFYVGLKLQGEQSAPITLNDQNDKLKKISTAAQRLAKALGENKPCMAWVERLQGHLDMNSLDFNTQSIIVRHLNQKDENIWLGNFLDILWSVPLELIDDKSHRAFIKNNPNAVNNDLYKYRVAQRESLPARLLPHLNNLATLREAPTTNIPRWADPYLYFLIERLVPLWREATGRSHVYDGKARNKHHFYEWLKESIFENLQDCKELKNAGYKGFPTAHQVNEIALRMKIKK